MELTPKTFFEVVVVEMLQKKGDAFQQSGKTCEFVLLGEGGGCWVVDMGQKQLRSTPEAKPDFRLQMSVADFQEMMLGKLNIDGAIAEGRVALEGDPVILGTFGRLIAD